MNIYILASGIYKVVEGVHALFVVDIPSGPKSWWDTGVSADKAWIPDEPETIPEHIKAHIEEQFGCTEKA